MINEESVKAELREVQDVAMKEIDLALSKVDYDIQNMLSKYVASVCNVEEGDMLAPVSNLHATQARWLYWYALRYMTGATYDHIAEMSAFDGAQVRAVSVSKGIAKISVLIDRDRSWTARWRVIKHIIKLVGDVDKEEKKSDYRVQIHVPEEMKDNIDVVIRK